MNNMDLSSFAQLNNGREIPALGFGTWELYGDEAYRSVKFALELGVRHIDTASMYENEEEVGRAVRDSGIPRGDIFITSKVWNDEQGYEPTLRAFRKSLERLGMDYLDMYMVHWPVRGKRIDTYKAIEFLYKESKVINVGVCNYLVKHLEEVLELSDTPPAVNQIELHPFDYKLRKSVIDFCSRNSIQIEAYRPLAKASQNDNAVLKRISDKYRVSVPRLLLRWGLQKGFVVIPRSSNTNHIKENINLYNFKISSEDTITLDNLNQNLSSTRFSPEDFL